MAWSVTKLSSWYQYYYYLNVALFITAIIVMTISPVWSEFAGCKAGKKLHLFALKIACVLIV